MRATSRQSLELLPLAVLLRQAVLVAVVAGVGNSWLCSTHGSLRLSNPG